MKIFVAIISCLSLVDLLAATELPAPFTQFETTSTAGGNGTAYTWVADETGISGDIYAGRTFLGSLSTSASFSFKGVSGLLKFKCTNYVGGMGCLDPYWFCAWLTDDVLINNWSGEVNGNSYKEDYVTCYFTNAGTHTVTFSISMQKQASKYYVQGPRLKIQDIEWHPDYVETNVDGVSLRIPGDWIRRNIASNVLQACRYDYGNIIKRIETNGYTVLNSYIAGLVPTNSNSKLLSSISIMDGHAVITWTPKLDNRKYTVYGKASLEPGEEWHSPTNALDRFFKVGVEMK
jgi:hypothetical protein